MRLITSLSFSKSGDLMRLHLGQNSKKCSTVSGVFYEQE